jgi:hypothetical protein
MWKSALIPAAVLLSMNCAEGTPKPTPKQPRTKQKKVKVKKVKIKLPVRLYGQAGYVWREYWVPEDLAPALRKSHYDSIKIPKNAVPFTFNGATYYYQLAEPTHRNNTR